MQVAGISEFRAGIVWFGRVRNQCIFVKQVWYVVYFPVCYVRMYEKKIKARNTGDKAMR